MKIGGWRNGLGGMVLLAGLFLMVGAVSCSKDPAAPPSDGDLEAEEEEQGRCEEGALGCSGPATVIVCQGGRWNFHAACPEGKVCEKGLCVKEQEPSDGDPEETESDVEPEPEIETEDLSPPRVESTSPHDGELGVGLSIGQILINFNEPLDTSRFLPQRDVSLEGGPKPILFTVSLPGEKRQLRLDIEQLDPGATYTVEVAADVLFDRPGNAFPGITFSFTTLGEADGDYEFEEDKTPPAISSTRPRNGEDRVARDLDGIQIFFTEEVDPYDWDPVETVTVAGDDGHRPAFEAVWLNNHHLLNLNLKQVEDPLHDDTVYEVTLAAGLKDREHNAAGAMSFHFSTGSLADGDDEVDASEGETEVEAEPDVSFDTGILASVTRSTCLTPPENYNPADYPVSLSAVWVPGQPGKLRVIHHAVAYDACLTSVDAELAQNGLTLELRESAYSPAPCLELCPYDVTMDVIYLQAGLYTIDVWSALAAEPLGGQAQVP